MPTHEVLIIGAGPVGLTLANELARRGVMPRIVDKAPAIREVSKALILHVRTQEMLGRVGVMERLAAEARPLTEVVVHAYGKHVGSWNLAGIDSPYPHPLIIGQNRTQHGLLALLRERGVAVEWAVEAQALALDEAGATVTLAGANRAPETARFSYVVGAEGSNSLVRRTLGIAFEGERYAGEQFIQADCRIEWALPRGRSYLFLTADGYMMVIEMPDCVRIFISLPDASADGAEEAGRHLGAVEAVSEQPTLEEIQHHLVGLSGFEARLSDPVWLARYRTSHRYAATFRKGRAFIAGDAAHVHVPIGGQGMNTGIQDAFNLGWKLAGVIRGELAEGVLDSYSAERLPVAAGLIRGTDFAYRGVLHPSEIRQRAARVLGPFLIRSERVQEFMRDTLEELSISYPDSEFNIDLGGARGPKPGERVLDADVVRASDLATTTLARVTAGERWSLLLFGGEGKREDGAALAQVAARAAACFGERLAVYPVIASARVPAALAGHPGLLLDALHILHGRYGISAPALYLLRPDTYVGGRAPLGRWEDVSEALRRIVVPAAAPA
ncbi:FAD-dependent monooxygenase [Methylobacterium sp. JK268]